VHAAAQGEDAALVLMVGVAIDWMAHTGH